MKIRLKFEPRDIWIGVFWDTGVYQTSGMLPDESDVRVMYTYSIYICLIPLLPICIHWEREQTPEEERAILKQFNMA